MADEITVKENTLANSIKDTVFDGTTTDTQPNNGAAAATTTETKPDTTPAATTTTVPDDAAEFAFDSKAAATNGTTNGASNGTETKAIDWKEAIKNVKPEELLSHMGVDEWGQKFIDYRKKGGDPVKYLQAKGTDWAKVNDIDVVRDDFARKYPTLSPDKIQKLFDKEIASKYSLNDEDEESKELGKIRLEADAHELRQKRIEEASNFQIPGATKPEQETVPDIRPMYMNSQATKDLLQNKKVVAEGSKDGYKFTFNVNDAQPLLDVWLDGETSAKYLFDEKGNPDIQRQSLMSLVAMNPKFVIDSLIDFGRKIERKSRLNSPENGAEEGKTTPVPGSESQPDWSKAREGKVGNHVSRTE